jgi:gamma-glutamylcysteine synthetase
MCVPNVAEGGLVTEAFAEVHLGNGEDKVNLDAANLVASAFDLAWVEWARRFPKGERNSVLQEETAREIFEAVPSIIARSGASSNVRARAQEAHSIVKKHLGWNQGAREGARP